MTLRLAICDDHSMFADALRTALTMNGFAVTGVVGDARSAVELTRRTAPQLILLDEDLPGGSGIEAARQIRAESPEVRVLMLTGSVTPSVWAAFDIGIIDGVAVKTCPIKMVIGAIKRVVAGERATVGCKRAPSDISAAALGAQSLTQREREVLQCIANGTSTDVIAATMGVSTNTVRSYVQHSLHKLGVHGRTSAVSVAIELGIVSAPNVSLLEARTHRPFS